MINTKIKLTIDCSSVGEITVVAEGCLFTPENADYSQTYQVFFEDSSIVSDANCVKNISDENSTLTYALTYSEAEACGWEWSTANNQLVFTSFLRASSNVNKITYGGNTFTISQFPLDIDVSCKFDNHVTVSADFFGVESNLTQTSDRSEHVSLADGFDVNLFNSNADNLVNFTIGEAITAKFDFDVAGAGHTANTMPFGFFAETCHIENNLDSTQVLDLIGGSPIKEQCKMDNSILDLHLATSYTGGETGWSVEEYELVFDAFKFQNSSSMTLVCEFQLCLKADCDSLIENGCTHNY